MLDSEFFDELEIRDADERELSQFEALGRHLTTTCEGAPYYQDLFQGIDAASIKTRADLEKLPITRKSALSGLQAKNPPFAGITAIAPCNFQRLYQSPGPTYEPEADGADWWGIARSLYAAGVRPGEILHNSFSYHLTPAGMMLESAARAIGCAVVPAGTGQSEQQVQAIAHFRPQAYAGTPSFLKILLEKAKELGADVSSLGKAVVSGEALPTALRDEIKAYGVFAVQIYASADLGLIAYETKAMEGLIVDERLIVEIVRPGTGEQLPPGEIGEVVVTSLNREYPLIRFATGDLSSLMDGQSPCGRTGPRLTGWKGRADQSAKVKGMFITPGQIADVIKRHPEIAKARLVIDQQDGRDAMTLNIEPSKDAAPDTGAVTATLQALSKLKGVVVVVDKGSLANDGIVIEDQRAAQ